MKTAACFIVIWITSVILLLLQARHFHILENHVNLGGAQISWTNETQWSREFWHALWLGAVYSLITTFIVRFWQMVLDNTGKKG